MAWISRRNIIASLAESRVENQVNQIMDILRSPNLDQQKSLKESKNMDLGRYIRPKMKHKGRGMESIGKRRWWILVFGIIQMA